MGTSPSRRAGKVLRRGRSVLRLASRELFAFRVRRVFRFAAAHLALNLALLPIISVQASSPAHLKRGTSVVRPKAACFRDGRGPRADTRSAQLEQAVTDHVNPLTGTEGESMNQRTTNDSLNAVPQIHETQPNVTSACSGSVMRSSGCSSIGRTAHELRQGRRDVVRPSGNLTGDEDHN